VTSYFHHDRPASEQRQDFGVVVGDIGHAGHKDDRRDVIVAARIEVVDSNVAVVGESRNDHGQRHFKACRAAMSM
jgi:hypothetical protein